jgi:hypothetical protein
MQNFIGFWLQYAMVVKLPCVMAVFDSLVESRILYDFLKNFLDSVPATDGYPHGNVRFVVSDVDHEGDTIRPDATGITSKANPENGQITITLNNKIFGAGKNVPILKLALTIMHESLHAELYRYLYNIDRDWDAIREDFPELWESYIIRSGQQHDLMGRKYLGLLADGTEKFDKSQRERDFYERISWSGLYSTTFATDFANSNPDEVENIIETVDKFENDEGEEICN